MTSEIQFHQIKQSAHGLKSDCLSFGEVLAQSFAVIAPTAIPASNLGLIVALAGNGAWLSTRKPNRAHFSQQLNH